MAWASPVTYATGNIVTASAWNIASDDLVVMETAIPVWAPAIPMAGGSPPLSSIPQYYIVAGQVSGTTGSSAGITATFPTAFPGGLLTAVAIPSQGSSNVGFLVNASGSNASQAQFTAFCEDGSGGFESKSIIFAYVAIGW